eukprot:1392090-Amorphochlora_amoeboformis.AAC.1
MDSGDDMELDTGSRVTGIRLPCPRHLVGRVIGPGGSNIRRLQEESGAQIKIDSTVDPPLVSIYGPLKAQEKARIGVMRITDPPKLVLKCDRKFVGQVIGPKGSMIRSIREKSGGARIQVDSNAAGGPTITITGDIQAIQAASMIIRRIIDPPRQVIRAPRKRLGVLIGPGTVLVCLKYGCIMCVPMAEV